MAVLWFDARIDAGLEAGIWLQLQIALLTSIVCNNTFL